MVTQRGMTLTELLVVVAVASLTLLSAAAYSVPMIAREGAKSAAFEVQSLMQLTRAEAVKRNRDVRLTINKKTRKVAVMDTMGTSTKSDDEMLHSLVLSNGVRFASPDGSTPITITRLGGPSSNRYESQLTAQGLVSSGPGTVTLLGGGYYTRLALYKAGGTFVEHWNGSAWVPGT